jgi:glycosyltransferase involved in cell wall biosynthesis
VIDFLSKKGCQIIYCDNLNNEDFSEADVIITHNPHTKTETMELLAASHAAKKPVILDLDFDLEQMPVSNPEYEKLGLYSPKQAKAYAAALLLADVICVPHETFANSLSSVGSRVHVIPDGWSDDNSLWSKPIKPRHTLNLGWVGSPGEVEDVFHIRRMVVRVVREFPQVRLVVSGDPAVYQLFDSLPESRRLYLPLIDTSDYPYILGQMDILMVPQRNTLFNRSLSDRRLMEAGARGIPWIASPMPAYVAWNTGGLIANSADEWHTYLRQLILDLDLRQTLSAAGRNQANARKMSQIGKFWLELIYSLTLTK